MSPADCPPQRCSLNCKATRSAILQTEKAAFSWAAVRTYVLREENVKLLRVFVRAPLEKRIARKMQQENLTREKAVRLVRKMDKQRKKYYESYTGLVWGAPDGCDLCIDTGVTDFDAAVGQICAAYSAM